MTVDIDIDASDALEKLSRLEVELEEEIPEAVEKAAKKGEENAREQLIRQGSVATETGINSLDTVRLQKNTFGVIGRSYLELVDTGTGPHTPDVNKRLVVWAEQEGWDVDDLVEHIEEEGTKPMPRSASWREIAFDPVQKSLPNRVVRHAKRKIDI